MQGFLSDGSCRESYARLPGRQSRRLAAWTATISLC